MASHFYGGGTILTSFSSHYMGTEGAAWNPFQPDTIRTIEDKPKVWKCDFCGAKHKIEQLKCDMCNASRPDRHDR